MSQEFLLLLECQPPKTTNILATYRRNGGSTLAVGVVRKFQTRRNGELQPLCGHHRRRRRQLDRLWRQTNLWPFTNFFLFASPETPESDWDEMRLSHKHWKQETEEELFGHDVFETGFSDDAFLYENSSIVSLFITNEVFWDFVLWLEEDNFEPLQLSRAQTIPEWRSGLCERENEKFSKLVSSWPHPNK